GPAGIGNERIRDQQLSVVDCGDTGNKDGRIGTSISVAGDERNCKLALLAVQMLRFGVGRRMPIAKIPQILGCVSAAIVGVKDLSRNVQGCGWINGKLRNRVVLYVNDQFFGQGYRVTEKIRR